MQAADIMTVGIVTATPEMPVKDAATLMLEKGISVIDRDRNVPGGSTLPTDDVTLIGMEFK